MKIRNETSDDIVAISQMHYAAFKDHPQHLPGAEPTEHLIVERLRQAGALSLSLVAEEDGMIIGHIAMSPAEVGGTNGWYLVGPLGVSPQRQRQGIGSALMREAMAGMRAMGAAGIVLVGYPAFYRRFGFTSHPGLTVMNVPSPNVLGLSFGDVFPQGEIMHHEAFGLNQ